MGVHTPGAEADGLLPKQITGVSSFTARTGCDGSGTVVAILDTGVDPGAAGLATTPDGRPKILDLVDCTGSGDVDMSHLVTPPQDEHTLRGLSGRTLTLSTGIRAINPSGTYRLGIKPAYRLLPKPLVRRLKRERRADWDRIQRIHLANVRRRLNHLRTKAPSSPPSSEDSNPDEQAAATGSEDTPEQDVHRIHKLELEELEAQETALLTAEKEYEDVGPLFDCVVFHDGDRFRAIVDTTETGDLSACPILEDFSVRRNYGSMNGLINYAVNVYDNGCVLSIVVDCGMHGTHVAGIVAANFPESEALSGVAPGAQIVSLMIGDNRLDAMETHQGLARALTYLLAHTPDPAAEANPSHESLSLKSGLHPTPLDGTTDTSLAAHPEATHTEGPDYQSAGGERGLIGRAQGVEPAYGGAAQEGSARAPWRIDVVNMSFGEPTRYPDYGRLVELVNKVVRERNVIFLCSAGNNGPALSTVSAPGGTTDALIGVGAYITPQMYKQAYSALDLDVVNRLDESASEEKDGMPPEYTTPGSARRGGATVGSSYGISRSTPPKGKEKVCTPATVPGMPYTWTSRGPTPDGDLGVTICAPGGAIAPVPQWSLMQKKLMNGTSMASPNAAGAVAVLVSFLKKRGIPYTSERVRSAIENSAIPLSLAQLRPESAHPDGAVGASHSRAETSSACRSEYERDLVFAGGAGSINVEGAAALLTPAETRMIRKPVTATNAQTVVRQTTPSNPRENVSIDAVEAGDVIQPTVADLPKKRAPLDDILDWQFRVVVESVVNTASRRGNTPAGVGSLGCSRGVYLRGTAETNGIQRVGLRVEPRRNDHGGSEEFKAALANLEVSVSVEATVDWIEAPKTLFLHGSGRTMPVVVDPRGLAEGQVHFARVEGYVENGKGARYRLFHVPVTVTKPEPLPPRSACARPLTNVVFSPGAVLRRFYEAPHGSSYAILRLVGGDPATSATRAAQHDRQARSESVRVDYSTEDVAVSSVSGSEPAALSTPVGDPKIANRLMEQLDAAALDDHVSSDKWMLDSEGSLSADSRIFEIHVVQLAPSMSFKQKETHLGGSIIPGATREFLFEVDAGRVLELCIAQRWSAYGTSTLDRIELMFCGMTVEPSVLHMRSGFGCFPKLEVSNNMPGAARGLGSNTFVHSRNPHIVATFYPRASLTHLCRAVAPNFSKITPLGPQRDLLPGGAQTYQLVLEYKFEVSEVTSTVSVSFPALNGKVYDAAVEGGPYVCVFDSNRQLVMTSDIYPEQKTLGRGSYYVRAAVRHDKVSVLEHLKDLNASVSYRLSSISLDCFETAQAACLSIDSSATRGKDWKGILEPGESRALYFAAPKRSSIPRWSTAGDSLVGDFAVDEPASWSNTEGRGSLKVPRYSLSMTLGPHTTLGSKSVVENLATGDQTLDAKPAQAKDAEPSNDGKERSGEGDDDAFVSSSMKPFKVKALRGLLKEKKLSAFDRLAKVFESELQDDTSVLMLRLQAADAALVPLMAQENPAEEEVKAKVEAVVAVADMYVSAVDPKAVALHFGMRLDPESTKESAARKKFETKRAGLVAALFRKSRALCFLARLREGLLTNGSRTTGSTTRVDPPASADASTLPSATASGGERSQTIAPYGASYRDLSRWVRLDGKSSVYEAGGSFGESGAPACLSQEDFATLAAHNEILRRRFGSALKILDAYASQTSSRPAARSVTQLRDYVLDVLSWQHVRANEGRRALLRYPVGLELF